MGKRVVSEMVRGGNCENSSKFAMEFKSSEIQVIFFKFCQISKQEMKALTAAAWPYQSALPVASEQRLRQSEGSDP